MGGTKRIIALGIAGGLAFCGGELVIDQPPGQVGPDGGYVSPDGAPVFAPGSGCNGYQLSSQLAQCEGVVTEGCTYGFLCDGDNAQSANHCAEQARGVLPAGYPFFSMCRPYAEVEVCVFNKDLPVSACLNRVARSPSVECHVGSDGDAFCSAYLTQFVLGDGMATAKCVPCQTSALYDGMCFTTTQAPDGGSWGGAFTGEPCMPGDCSGLDMCVTRNGQSRCEPPCMAP